jgi:type II secretory pathway pseudopilin PulG
MRPADLASDRSDRGETLLELLISTMILGIASTSIFGLAQMAIGASDIHHKQTVAGSILDNFAEYMQTPTSAPYVACPGAVAAYDADRTSFETALSTASSKVYEPDFKVGGTVRYTVNATIQGGDLQPAGSDPSVVFAGTCTSVETAGLQQLTLTVTSKDSRASESTVIVKRMP